MRLPNAVPPALGADPAACNAAWNAACSSAGLPRPSSSTNCLCKASTPPMPSQKGSVALSSRPESANSSSNAAAPDRLHRSTRRCHHGRAALALSPGSPAGLTMTCTVRFHPSRHQTRRPREYSCCLKIADPDWRLVVQCNCCCRHWPSFSQVRLLVTKQMLRHKKGRGTENFHPIKLGCCTVPRLV